MEEWLVRFWNKVDKRDANGCWLWTGSKKPFGYGQIMVNGKMKRAHRLSWEIHAGQQAPVDMVVRHSCDNPPCVNPNHLSLGTQKENIREAQEKGRLFNPHRRKTHCPKGHPYDGANTVFHTSKHGVNGRTCKTCTRLYRARKRRERHDIHPVRP